MLSLVSLVPKTGSVRFYPTSFGISNICSISCASLGHNLSGEIISRRSPTDFLEQGSVFDSFGNKSVVNYQTEGSFATIPTVNGQTVTRSLFSKKGGAELRIYSEPPAIVLNYSTYAWVDALPVEFSGRNKLGLRWYLGFGYVFPLSPVEGNPAIGSCQAVVTFDSRGRFVSASGGGNVPFANGYIDSSATGLRALLPTQDATSYDSVWTFVPALRTFCYAMSNVVRRVHDEHIAKGDSVGWNSATIRSASVKTPDFSDVILYARQGYHALSAFHPSSDDLSLQARETIENLNDFNSNLIAYASDLKKTGDTIRELLHLAVNFRSPKAWASAWLSGHYGDRLAVQDTRELLMALSRRLTTRTMYASGRTRKSYTGLQIVGGIPYSITCDYLMSLTAENESYNGLMTAIGNLMRWDAWPTLENSWDLIPLSFLVDWFLPVSDLLGQIDAAVEAPYIRPASEYVGERLTCSLQVPSSSGLKGTINLRLYRRGPQSILDKVRPFDVLVTPPSFSVVHTVDALALLVQNKGA